MSLASDIIRRAYRETNLIPVGQTPSANLVAEALESLNGLILSTAGNEAGNAVADIIIGGDFDESDLISEYVPPNTRLVLRTEDPIEVGLCPRPQEGARFAIVDTSGDLSVNPITINANGRLIEGSDSIDVDVNFVNSQWMFRADTSNWVLISSLIDADDMPFPPEFDDYFITMLAMRLDPRYSQTITPETMQALSRSRSQLRARYSQRKQAESDVKPFGLRTERMYNSYPNEDFDAGTIN